MLFTYWPLFLFQDILFPIYVSYFIKLHAVIDSITCQSAPVIQRILFLYFIRFTIKKKHLKSPNFFFICSSLHRDSSLKKFKKMQL